MTWFNSFPARAVLRAVAATFWSYYQAFLFSCAHEGHDQYFTITPGRARVVCNCGADKCL
jgi:hypothetical protein